jgi:hypothetical protein
MAIPNLLIEFENFRHSREGFAQIILALQLVGNRPIKWNTPYPLGEFGRNLLQAIYTREFQMDLPLAEAQVYWEFKLSKQTDEGTCWPDLAVRTEQRIILFELKTEAGSIREGQVDEQLALGRHHFPALEVDMIYITTDPIDGAPLVDPRSRYLNLTWSAIADIERSVSVGVAEEQAILAMICDYLDGLQGISSRQKQRKKSKSQATLATNTQSEVVMLAASALVDKEGQIDYDAVLQAFRRTESTRNQQALDLPCKSPNDARRLIDEIERRIKVSNQDASLTPILHTRAWVWTPESRGVAMTESGGINDVEVRVSRYDKVQRSLA